MKKQTPSKRENHVTNLPHPMQPIGFDDHGTVRFKANAIVRFLLDDSEYDLNHIGRMLADGVFSNEDYTQLMQLIGYSVSGYGELSTSPKHLVASADSIASGLLAK